MKEYFKCLDDLRDSGTINMFGAARKLRDGFSSLNRTKSRTILSLWMETYGSGKDINERVAIAFKNSIKRVRRSPSFGKGPGR